MGKDGEDDKSAGRIADVLVPVALDAAFSYTVPAGMDLAPGDFVEAPLGSRLAAGVVWDIRPAPPGASNLKSVAAKLDWPPLQPRLRKFIDWVARWTMSPRGMVLRMGVRAPSHAGPEPVRVGVRLAGPPPQRMTPARSRVLAAAEGGLIFPKSALAEAAACSAGVIDGLVDEGALETIALPPEPAALPCDSGYAAPDLEPDQARAAEILTAAVRARAFSVTLLEGVTGSGKTEVYFEAIAAAVRDGRQALVLMPEIALTAQFLDRFAARFGARPAEWHSAVGARKRARVWSALARGEVKVVAGARSALYLPFSDLALIVVDEEHDAAYKQEDGVSYHARDMAVVRGQIEASAVILASATPSIETRVNAEQGRYGRVRLDGRYKGRALPRLTAVDMRLEPPGRGKWISPRLKAALTSAFERGEQGLLFLNRRGYAPLTLCRSCGHRFQCPNCTAWLVDHRFRRALVCHHCGHIERRPQMCPNCEAVDQLSACGPGVERLAEEAAETFPDARTMVLSSDFPGGSKRLRNELDAIAQGECDLIIGTQLVAKGHNFPLLSVVGVIDADIGLSSGDPRAAERTFQLLQQVTGRAGRFDTRGEALVQTFQPEHPVMRALLSGDCEKFYLEETQQRLRAGLPPFGRLAALIVSGKDAASAETHARALARAAYELPPSPTWRLAPAGGLPRDDEIRLLGPAEAPIAIIRGRHRFRLLARSPRNADLQGFLRALLAAGPKARGGVGVAVDIEPQSFL
ncbi:primosomal protein N' [Methylocapsa palsarum]|uniref:Replication restart protein PriA n=1 Tax=Methylocapsa palsarum TaxID=1612308 RepID=A0A1I3VV53_9HYPH|nr:primosomal protein N' [Methylocapsa palsarum]SFJ99258.1 replication restart DNA helicase PriA [Methylocapsa palsarum]